MVFWVLLSSNVCFHVNFYCSDKQKFPEKEFDHRARHRGKSFKATFEAMFNLILLPLFMRTHDLFVVEIRTKFEGSTHISRLSCRHRWESNLDSVLSIMPSPRGLDASDDVQRIFSACESPHFQNILLKMSKSKIIYIYFITHRGFKYRIFVLFSLRVTKKVQWMLSLMSSVPRLPERAFHNEARLSPNPIWPRKFPDTSKHNTFGKKSSGVFAHLVVYAILKLIFCLVSGGLLCDK